MDELNVNENNIAEDNKTADPAALFASMMDAMIAPIKKQSEQNNAVLVNKMLELQKQISDAEHARDIAIADITTERDKIKRLENEKRALEEEKQKLQNQAQGDSITKEEVQALKNKIQNLSSENGNLRANNTRLNDQLSVLTSEQKEKNVMISELKEEKARIEAENERLTKEQADNDNSDQVNALRDRISSLELHNNNIGDELSVKEEKITELENEQTKLKETIDQITKEKEALEARPSSAVNDFRVKELEEQLEHTKEELEEVQDNFDIVKKNMEELNSKHSSELMFYRKQVNHKESEIVMLQNKLEKLRDANGSGISQEQKEKYESEIFNLKKELESAKTSVSEGSAPAADTKKLEDEIKSLKYLAYTDPKTGLSNVNAFNRCLYELEDVKPVTLAMLTINGLAEINAEWGKDNGDKVVKITSKVLKDSFGKDYVYRTMGAQFAVVVDDNVFSHASAKAMMADIKHRLDNEDVQTSYGIVHGSRYEAYEKKEAIAQMLRFVEDKMLGKTAVDSSI